MGKKVLGFLLLFLLLLAPARGGDRQTLSLREGIDMGWWQEGKLGLFLVWGLYSATGCTWDGKQYSEFVQLGAKIPVKKMREVASGFNPIHFDADAMIRRAKEAGMTYVVITAKHHEGFAMYDSPSSDYDMIDATPFGRDPLREISQACEKYGLRFCVYYSLGRDWDDPDCPSNWPQIGGRSNDWDFPNEREKVFERYYERKVKPQVIELLTQYKVDMMWFDTHGFCTPAQSAQLMEIIEHYSPGCLVHDRVGTGLGDFFTPEQTVINEVCRQPWESCITASRVWGYSQADTIYKSSEVLVRLFVDIVAKGGNLLLNVPPDDKGAFLPAGIDRLAAIGRWMGVNGEAIYGTLPWHVFGENFASEKLVSATDNDQPDTIKDETAKGTEPDVRFTSKGDTLYVIARSWTAPRVRVEDLLLTPDQSIESVSLLGYAGVVNYARKGNGLVVDLPAAYRPEIPVYVYKVALCAAN